MNNIETMLFMTWILMALSGIFAYRSYLVVQAWLTMRRRKNEYASLKRARQNEFCETSHKWDKMKLAMAELPVDTYTICVSCGYIAGTKYSLNKPAMEIFLNNVKLREHRMAAWTLARRLKVERTDKLMNDLIKRHCQNFNGDLQKNIESLQQFFRSSVSELDVLYDQLDKELEEEMKRG